MSSPSALMIEAFCGAGIGSPTLTCWCGRVHHAPASDFLEEGEEEQMREDAKNNPQKVFLHDGDGVSAITVNGTCVVHGCDCNWLGRLEAILWSERDRILKYYKLRRDAASKDAVELSVGLGENS